MNAVRCADGRLGREEGAATLGPLRLGDLLDQADLGLTLVAGGDEARRRSVVGAHSIDIAEPSRWLERDWVMLTTGARLAGDAKAAVRLVDELTELGAAAIGFGLGVGSDGPPSTLVAQSRRRGLAVFTVPFDTAFRDIEVRVHRAHLSEEVRLAQRLTSMQRHLLGALADAAPDESLVERLAALTGLGAVLLAPTGEPRCCCGAVRVPTPWRELLEGPRATVELELDGERCIATPIDDDGSARTGWLVLVGARAVVPRRLVKALIQVARPMAMAASSILNAQRRHERAVRAGLLGALFHHDNPVAATMLAAPLADAGIDVRSGARALVVRGGRVDAASVETALNADGIPSLVMSDGSTVAALAVTALDRLRVAATTLADAEVGIGREIHRIADAPASYHDAKLALVAGGVGEVTALEDVSLATLLLAEAPAELTLAHAELMLAPLQAHPALEQTLVSYFQNDLDVVRTASALHLHPNSLRYRLTRIEEQIGASLRNVGTISTLHLALSACELHGRPAPVSSPAVPLKNGA